MLINSIFTKINVRGKSVQREGLAKRIFGKNEVNMIGADSDLSVCLACSRLLHRSFPSPLLHMPSSLLSYLFNAPKPHHLNAWDRLNYVGVKLN